MQTRTELILLQRTMVVVEGVARSLDPHVNIWTVARPVVEGYIANNVGPKALLRDLARTAQVLMRFGPKLPTLVEERLLRPPVVVVPPRRRPWMAVALFAAGAASALAGVAVGHWL